LENQQEWHPITLAYARAVAELQSRANTDPTSWIYQAAIHGSSATPARAGWNQCQHGGWFFLPWHRLYLYHFERIVRSVVLSQGGPDDWALPYWNYDAGGQSNSLPLPFREETLPDGSPNPLFVGQRNATINNGAGLPSTATSASVAMGLADFAPPPFPGFGGGQTNGPRHFFNAFGALESTPHNVVHVLVGGIMGDPNTAALDPIFWLHHANIDRLWMEWNDAGNGNPSDAAWNDQTFQLFDDGGNAETRPLGDANDPIGVLGYRYDTIGEEGPPVGLESMAEAKGEAPEPEMVGAHDEAISLEGASQSVDVPVDSRAVEGMLEEGVGAEHLYLSLEHVDADTTPRQAYAVYLEGADQRRFHVGNLALFGIERLHEEGGDAPHEQRFMFDVSHIAAELGGMEAVQSLRVTFEKLDLEGGTEGLETVEEEIVPIRVGRVTFRMG
jgi:hypothetical protein